MNYFGHDNRVIKIWYSDSIFKTVWLFHHQMTVFKPLQVIKLLPETALKSPSNLKPLTRCNDKRYREELATWEQTREDKEKVAMTFIRTTCATFSLKRLFSKICLKFLCVAAKSNSQSTWQCNKTVSRNRDWNSLCHIN